MSYSQKKRIIKTKRGKVYEGDVGDFKDCGEYVVYKQDWLCCGYKIYRYQIKEDLRVEGESGDFNFESISGYVMYIGLFLSVVIIVSRI